MEQLRPRSGTGLGLIQKVEGGQCFDSFASVLEISRLSYWQFHVMKVSQYLVFVIGHGESQSRKGPTSQQYV